MKKNILIFIAMLLTGVNASLAAGIGNTGWGNIVINISIPGGDADSEPGSPLLYLNADGTVSTSSSTDALFSIKLWGNFIYHSGYIGYGENTNEYNYLKISSLRSGYYIKKIVLYDSDMNDDGQDDHNPEIVTSKSNGTWTCGYYTGSQSTSPITTTVHDNENGTHIVATCSSSTDNNYVTIKADDHSRFHYIYIEYIKPITDDDITVEVDPVVFDGSEYNLADVKSKVKVYDMIGSTKTQLTEGTHYTLSLISGHSKFLNAKTYVDELVITGKNGYSGERKANFTILPRDISEVALTTAKAYATGWSVDQAGLKTWIQADAQGNIKYGSYKLIENTDYTINIATDTYHDAKVYTGAITLTAKDNGNFTGTATWDFEISNGTNIAENYTVVYVGNIYTGQNLPPTKANTKVYKGGTLLTADTDYTWAMAGGAVDYKDAKTYANAVIIKGKNQYFGTIYANYEILPYNIADAKVTVTAADMKWTGNVLTKTQGATDGYTIKFDDGSTNGYNLVKTTDYNITSVPEVIQNEGEYSLVFEGVGNFTGTKSTKFDVKKDMSDGESVTGIHFDIPTQIKNGTFDFSVVATDTKSHTTLHEGTDFTMTFKNSSNADIAENAIADEGMYKVIFSGVAPKYDGTRTVDFYVVKPYQTVAAGEYAAVSLHITEPGYPVAENSPTGAVVIGEMQVGAGSGAAVAADAKRVLIPGNNSVTVGGTNIVFNIVGIENGAFNGCTELRFIGAHLIANYTPSSLSRTATNTPFTGVPKQTLVYLTGTTVEGENYIYYTGAGVNCETFKIYDDISGTQTGFTTATDAKWDMEIPAAFTANNIVNTRKLTAVANNKQQGYTVCLPYALPIPESVTAYQLSYSKGATTIGTDNYDGILGFTEVAATKLTAMTPYVLIPSASGQCLSTTNATVSQTVKYESAEWKYEACTADPEASSAASGQNLYKLIGSMQYKEGDAAKDKYIMQGNNVWGKIAAGAGYSETDHSCILPMRAYIEANGIATARLFSTFNNADGSTTVVKGLKLDADAAGEIYDLQGRRVNAPQRGGLYIINGKKMIMK